MPSRIPHLEDEAIALTQASLQAWRQFDTQRSIALAKKALSLGLPKSSTSVVRARLRLVVALISVGRIHAAKQEIEKVENFEGLLSIVDFSTLLKVRGYVEAVQGRSDWSLYFG